MGAVAAGQHKVLDDKVGEGRGHPFVERGSAVLFVTKKKTPSSLSGGCGIVFFCGFWHYCQRIPSHPKMPKNNTIMKL